MDHSQSDEDDPTPGTTAKNRLRSLSHKVKDKAHQLKNRSAHGNDSLQPETHEALPSLEDDPAFNDDKVQEALVGQPESAKEKVQGMPNKIQKAIGTVMHPQQTARAKAAREGALSLAATPHSRPTNEDDKALMDVEAKLEAANNDKRLDAMLSEDDPGIESIDNLRDQIHELEEHKDKMKVGWAMTHVNRVRVVQSDRFTKPDWRDYMAVNQFTGKKHFDWLRYLGHLLLYETQGFTSHYIDDLEEPNFEPDVFRSYVERLAIATAPWQAFLMEVRQVYRWEYPVKTASVLLVYIFLWYTQHFGAFIVATIIWQTVQTRFRKTDTTEMKSSLKRAADSQSTAWQLGELIDKDSSEDWLEQLGKSLGPQAQLQLGDLADFLETVQNFREWKSPKATAATLCLLVVQFMYCFLSWDFCARYITGAAGMIFFVSFPIASHYPKYRYLVSVIKILWWNSPTHAEWAMSYLQRQAAAGQRLIIKDRKHKRAQGNGAEGALTQKGAGYDGKNAVDSSQGPTGNRDLESEDDEWRSMDSMSTTSSLADNSSTTIISFHVDWNGQHGRLRITSDGLRFVRGASKQIEWELPFTDLVELRKLEATKRVGAQVRQRLKRKAVSSGDMILLVSASGSGKIVRLPRDRDECFNCIIGFSRLQWQNVRSGEGKVDGHPDLVGGLRVE